MADQEHSRHGRRHRGVGRDFWRAWREEQQRRWEEEGGQPAGPGPFRPPFSERKRARFWRQFFHDFMGTWPEEHWAFGGRRFNPWHQGIDAFNPFVASLLSKGGGLLPLLVMHLLSEQPRYGNDIMDQITELTGGQWVANPGAIYPLMTLLEEQGLIEGEWEDPHKRTVRIYRLTSAGEQEMTRLKTIVLPKLEEAVAILRDLSQELNGLSGDVSDFV